MVSDAAVIKVASFNLKCDVHFGHKHRWRDRRQDAAQYIRQCGASIVGVQELLPQMKEDVQQMLTNYSVIGWGRYQGAKPSSDEHSDIIVNNDDMTVSSYKTFWLSKHPEEGCTRAYFSIFPRICTVAEIVVNDSNQRIRVFNTHFDHICGPARVLGVRIILQYMSRFNSIDPLPTILMGDMNCTRNSRPIRILRENRHGYQNVHLQDVYSILGQNQLNNTYHGFKGKRKTSKSPIDYIFVSDDFEVMQVEIDNGKIENRFVSDHYPILATLRLKKS
jgi:endonuclease/exonuclease/phosphatase family metal-dependent hydrolase